MSTPDWKAPRELVLASAGSGKTYHLSSQLLMLLARGVPIDQVLASTFTRKAAGEILERVLLRLARAARDPDAARELAEATGLLQDDRRFEGTGPWLDLLGDVIANLHRMRVSTVDSFLVQVATAFTHELALPPTWGIADESTAERLQGEVLDDVLESADREVLLELLRAANRGEVVRDVHRRLSEQAETLQDVLRQADPDAQALWAPPLDVPPEEPADLEEQARELGERISGLTPPPKAGGEPNSQWERPLQEVATALASLDWRAFLDAKLVGRFLAEDGFPYYRSEPTDEISEAMEEALGLARVAVGHTLRRESAAMGRLAALVDAAHARRLVDTGLLRFDDVTHRVARLAREGSLEPVFYRMDSAVRHLLLDEFQDTSLAQWDALAPLAAGVLDDPSGERAAVVVADPKQSIYGWRKARPDLAQRVGEEHDLTLREMDRSYRSSPVIVRRVQEFLKTLEDNPTAQKLNARGQGLERWLRGVTGQTAAANHPGYIRVVAGHDDNGRGTLRPNLLASAAQEIAEIHRAIPGAEIGVLVRSNKAVGFLVSCLRDRGVPASGEGGTPLTDTRPVNAVLAALRLADHPGDLVARYHVAQSSMGPILDFRDHRSDERARALSRSLRASLIRDGYGRTLEEWARAMDPQLTPRERFRVGQLVEEGYRWDDRSTLRPMDFVRRIERERREEAATSPVRVMTVHQSKGLEFDVVVLPDLANSLTREGSRTAIQVQNEEGRTVHVYPSVNEPTRLLLPEIEEAYQQDREARVLDALSLLYVAMTRARFALHVIVPPDSNGRRSTSVSGANLLRDAWCPGVAAEPEEVLMEDGDPDWAAHLPPELGGPMFARRSPAGPAPETETIPLRPAAGRSRVTPIRTPSGSKSGGSDLRWLLTTRDSLPLDRGTMIHAWCEQVTWIEDGLPDDETLRDLARVQAPRFQRPVVDASIERFRRHLEKPAIRTVLSRDSGDSDAQRVTVENELPFALVLEEEILSGTIDRLVLHWDGDEVRSAWIVDYKTDRVGDPGGATLEDRVEAYRPQMAAYAQAVGLLYQLPQESIRATLVFLEAGEVVDL